MRAVDNRWTTESREEAEQAARNWRSQRGRPGAGRHARVAVSRNHGASWLREEPILPRRPHIVSEGARPGASPVVCPLRKWSSGGSRGTPSARKPGERGRPTETPRPFARYRLSISCREPERATNPDAGGSSPHPADGGWSGETTAAQRNGAPRIWAFFFTSRGLTQSLISNLIEHSIPMPPARERSPQPN